MLPIIAAAVSFITFGLFEEKSKTKSTNNSGSSAKQTPKKTIGRKAKVVSINATDNKYRASKSGTRTSSKYASVQIRGGGMYHRRNANQYGKAKGGKTYTENRPNRSDSKMYLEKGGNISKIFEQYEENEDNNLHSENVVLLAKNFGSADDLKLAKSILKEHENAGSLSLELNRKRYELHQKLYPKMIQPKTKMEKGGNTKKI